jgi:hypothetical protein
MMHAIDCDHKTEISEQFTTPYKQDAYRLEAGVK